MITIGDMNKEQLLKILGDCLPPLKNCEAYGIQYQNIEKENIKNHKRNSTFRKIVAIVLYIYFLAIWCSGIIGALLATFLPNNPQFGALIGGVCGIALAIFLWTKRNKAVEDKITNIEQQINNIQNQIAQILHPIVDMYNTIPTDCRSAYAVEFLYNAIYSGMATDFASARNMLVADQRYREEMAQRKYQIDKEYQANLAKAAAMKESGRQIKNGLNNIANSNNGNNIYYN